jgi:hypothetical protein
MPALSAGGKPPAPAAACSSWSATSVLPELLGQFRWQLEGLLDLRPDAADRPGRDGPL